MKNNRRHRDLWHRVVGVMCCVVVFCVTYALILPAITMAYGQTLACPYEIHRHEDSCYDAEGKVICGYADYVVHIHDEAYCYDSQGNLVCPLEEIAPHTHDDSCYGEKSVLKCGTEESVGHVHDETCCTRERGELICTLTEDTHIHTDDCYELTETLTCGLEAGKGAHRHDENCYELKTVLICEQPEVILHTHSADCYEDILDGEGNVIDQTLICGKLQVEEHQHDESCLTVAEPEETSAATDESSMTVTEPEETTTAVDESSLTTAEPEETTTAVDESDLTAAESGNTITAVGESGMTAAVSGQNSIAANGLLYSARISGTCEGIQYTLTPAAGGGYRLILSAGDSTIIPSGLFSDETLVGYKDQISSVEIGTEITEIGTSAFTNLSALRTVSFDEGSALTTIGSGTFAGCENLTSVNLENCASLTTIAGGESIEAGAFYNTGLTEITIPGSVMFIGDFAFSGCKNLSTVNFVENTALTDMGAYVFANCTALERVNLENLIGDSLTFGTKDSVTIGETTIANGSGLFYGCTSLQSLTLPNMSGSIAYLCKGCSSLTSLNLNACAKLVCDDTTGNANLRKIIDGCESLETLDLSGVTGMTVFYQGIVGGDGENLVTSGVKTVILPSSVTEIDSYALGYSGVEQLIFTKDENGSSNLTTVGGTDYNNTQHSHALAAAQSLKEVELSFAPTAAQTELYLQSYAFENCSALERITISSPNGLSVFGTPSFLYGCGKLQELTWDVKSVTTTLTWWGCVDGNTSKNIRFTIGENVEVLPGYLLSSLQGNISEYSFVPNHSFYVDGYYDWSTSPATYYDTFGAPFTEAGCYYADANGNLYRLKDTTAELVYANRSGSGAFTVPGTITAKMCTASGRAVENTTFTVTGICADAFMGTAYSAITFANPAAITKLESNAFAGAYELESINDKTTEQEIKALFTNSSVTFGHDLFVGTKIESRPFESTTTTAVYPGSDPIWVTEATKLVQISAASDSKFTVFQDSKLLATGEPATVQMGFSNNDSGKATRLYIKVSDPDSFNLPAYVHRAAMQSTSVNGVYYYDLTETSAGTDSFGITCAPLVAPNKKAYVWLLETDSADVLTSIGGTVVEPGGTYSNGTATATASSQYIELTWDVLRKDYSVAKTANEAITPTVKKTAGAYSASTVVNLSFLVSNNMANRETTDGKSYDSYGADFVESVSFEDVLTLPEDLNWKDGLTSAAFTPAINADNTGGSITATVGGKDYVLCTLSLASGSLTELNCAAVDGNLKIAWTTANRDRTTEITAAVTTLTYGPEVIEVSGAVSGTTEYSVTNAVTATPKYTYSGTGAQSTATADSSLTANPSPLTASKEWVKKPQYMGEEAVYKITLDHVADANSTDDVYIHDDLDIHQYLAADEIEKMLLGSGYDGDYLTIVINNAVLLPVPEAQTVTAVDGETTAQTTVRSAAVSPVYNDLAKNYAYTSATLTMAKSGDSISLAVAKTGGETTTQTVSAGNLQEALDAIGYVRSIRGNCVLHWHFPRGTVQAAENHKEYELHTFVKNTFQVLTEDHNTSIVADVGGESHNYPVSNKLFISKEDYYQDEQRAIQTETVYPTYDLSIDKIAKVNGVSKDTSELAALMEERLQQDNGNFVIDYSLDIRHYGTGTYGLLPVVDKMTGVQALLAEVEDNKNEDGTAPSWAAYTETITLDGKDYYVLNAKDAGTGTAVVYKGVWLENGYADSVAVTKNDEGLDTLIKWYYIDNTGSNYSLTPAYRAICSLTYAPHDDANLYHFVYNEAWLNDIPTRRLHDNIGAEGASIAFEKHIVTKQGDTPDKDELWASSTTPYPIPGEGASVTYRLDFKNTGSQAISLTGADFYDVLPAVAVNAETGNPVFSWSDANVKISYVTIGDGVTVSDEAASGYNILRLGAGSESYQIQWDSNFKISYPAGVNGEVYVYVTLTFPTGEEWTKYVTAKGGAMLYNSLYVRDVASRVSHVLPNPGEAMLRKGVYETGYYVLANNVQSSSLEFKRTYQYFRGADRNHYVKTAADSETVKNTVTYFVTIYNSSETANLYLSPIYDKLPEGFEFYAMVATPDSTDSSAGYSGSVGLWNQWTGRQGDSVGLTAWDYAPLAKPASAKSLIKWVHTGDVHDNTVKVRTPYTERMLIFDVTLDAEHKDELGYYLKPGEAIQFGYMCFTGDAAATSADNRCAMEYLDYSGSGVTLTEEANQTVTVDNSVFTAPANTGVARLITNERAAELGFTTTNPANPAENPQWLISRVSLTEGNIIPGITTKVENYNVKLGESVVWKVTTTNSGTNAMRNYTLTDTIQSPFTFTGRVGYTVLSNNANADSVEFGERSRQEVVIAGNGTEDYLFDITAVSNDGVTLVSNKGGDPVTVSYGQEQELTVSTRFLQSVSAGGSYGDAKITVSFTKADNGDMTMIIKFADPVWSIPADGQSLLTVSTVASEATKANGVYVNNATVTPTQSFDAASVNQGTVSTDGKSDSSAASVNIYSGILTTAYKEVSSGEGDARVYGVSPNYAGKGENPDTILLTDKGAEITYTLNVNGTSNNNMQKLVVIDTLPQTGDTNPINDNLQRGSQFKVNFADDPKVTIKVVNTDGTETLLAENATNGYTVWYSTKISGFTKSSSNGVNGDYTSDEGNTDPTDWHTDLGNDDRSIRVVINRKNEDGTQKPFTENETVKISFHAVVDQSAKGDDIALPGETAWNNFGYSFYTGQMWLYAAPQKVGVTLKSAPIIEKKLVNSSGTPVAASEDITFHFVVYEGTDRDVVFDETTVGNALTNANVDFTYVTLTVKAGESLSDKLLLNPQTIQKYSYNNGFTPTETPWEWVDGEKYTVVELGESGEYAYGYVNTAENTNRAYTFTYDQTKNQTITVYNTRHDWSITLTKTNDKDKDSRLPGAVFGLYSANENPDIVEKFASFGLPESTATTYTAQDGTVWYLSQIAVTGEDGILTWEKLCEDRYYVLELRAPDGYIPSVEALTLTYEDARKNEKNPYIESRTVANAVGYELPKTGGEGTAVFTVSALVLMLGAGLVLIARRRGNVGKSR